jgi:type II secretory pathway pseudopilin PulG
MRFPKSHPSISGVRRHRAGFTLAEVLAALLFMAIVIPVAVEGLRLASQAGQVAQRKAIALRLAEQVLNEEIITGKWEQNSRNGTIQEGPLEFRWRLQVETWRDGILRLVSVQVLFPVQGQEHDVVLSTLVDNSTSTQTTNSTSTATSNSASGQAR